MLNKEIEPVFKPRVKSERDVSNIDKQFLNEHPVDSLVNNKLTMSQLEKAYFDKFTYNGDDEEFLLNDNYDAQYNNESQKK